MYRIVHRIRRALGSSSSFVAFQSKAIGFAAAPWIGLDEVRVTEECQSNAIEARRVPVHSISAKVTRCILILIFLSEFAGDDSYDGIVVPASFP